MARAGDGSTIREPRTRAQYGSSVLLELAASAFLACATSASDPLLFDEVKERYLPEWPGVATLHTRSVATRCKPRS